MKAELVCLCLFYIYSDMEQLQSGRGVPFVIFELRPLATKSESKRLVEPSR